MSEEQDIKVEDVSQEQDFLNMSEEELNAVDINSLGKPIQEDTSEDAQEDTLEADTDDSTEETDDSVEIDYKAEYERITAPFKANGKEVQVNSIDDAIQLMQMGADYQRKTTEIKPLRKIGEKLKQNGLLDEEQLNYLIDLKNKNPQAIQKLLKDSNIDPLDIDIQSESQYIPNSYTIDEKQIELNEVISLIRETPQYESTSKVLSNWDAESSKLLVDSPSLIATINDHIGNGIYGQIASVVEQQRMLGRLSNVSDIEAYRQVGEYLQANSLFRGQAKPEVIVPPVVNKPVQDNKHRKQAASITSSKTSTPKKDLKDVDWFNLSDEEFTAMEKQLLK